MALLFKILELMMSSFLIKKREREISPNLALQHNSFWPVFLSFFSKLTYSSELLGLSRDVSSRPVVWSLMCKSVFNIPAMILSYRPDLHVIKQQKLETSKIVGNLITSRTQILALRLLLLWPDRGCQPSLGLRCITGKMRIVKAPISALDLCNMDN